MEIEPNRTLARLVGGEVAIGIGITHLRSVAAVHIAKAAGYDWLFVDMEHGACSLDAATEIFMAGLTAGVTTFARVSRGDYATAARALDNGAQGVILPLVETADEVARAVEMLRYRPAGKRGWGGTAPQFGFRPPNVRQAMADLNRETALVIIVETKAGVENIDAIAAVDGVDVVLVGMTDLSVDLDIPRQYSAPEMQTAFANIAEASRRYGRFLGIGGIYDRNLAKHYYDLGARFLAGGSDHNFLLSSATARAEFLRTLPASC